MLVLGEEMLRPGH